MPPPVAKPHPPQVLPKSMAPPKAPATPVVNSAPKAAARATLYVAPAPAAHAPATHAPAAGPAPVAPPAPAPAPAAAAAPAGDASASSPRPGNANVIVLSADPALIDLLRDSLAGSHRVWRADDLSHAADLMVAAGNAVFLIDASLADHDTRDLVNQVKKQFPDLAIIVAGRRDDEALLAPLVSSGAIFRFLHKPASAERIRNFVDATQRRANPATDLPAAGRTASSTAITGTHVVLDPSRLDLPKLEFPKFKLDPALVRRWTRRSLLLLPLTLIIWGVMEWKPWDRVAGMPAKDESAQVAATDASQDPRVQRLLDLAGLALSQGRLVEPPEQNALELYRAVLARDPGNRLAQRGIDSVADELLVLAERALMEQDVTRLASAVDAARSARPDHPRLEFFTMQLERESDRAGPPGQAKPAAGRAPDAATPESDAARVQSLVQLASDRMKSGRLVGGRDSAHTHLLAALKLDPADAGLQQGIQTLSGLLQRNAREAIRENRLDDASGLVAQAVALDVNLQEIAVLRADIEAARVTNVRADRAKLLVLANQRIAQGRLIEPSGDSARHYIDMLRAADPTFEGLGDTTVLFHTSALTGARDMIAAGNTDRAEALLRAAVEAGAPASEVAAITTEIAAIRSARTAAARQPTVIPENQLRRTRTVSPVYPERARAKGVQGWVEVEYTVAADGTTRDAVVKAAEPAGVFDRAALSAIGRWRYEPHMVNGAAVEQRVSARVRFQLED
ncbi:MAG: TonB family protein [Gammaproteobacteria bacterium]